MDPDNYQVHALLGRIYFKKNLTKKAERSYAKSIELNSNYQPSRLGLAVVYYTQGQEVYSSNPSNARDLFKKAALQYEASVQIPDDTYEEFYYLGYIYARLQRYEDALIYLEKATKLTAENGDAFWFIGQVHQKLGQNDQAKEAYLAAQKLTPLDQLAHKKPSTKQNSSANKLRFSQKQLKGCTLRLRPFFYEKIRFSPYSKAKN